MLLKKLAPIEAEVVVEHYHTCWCGVEFGKWFGIWNLRLVGAVFEGSSYGVDNRTSIYRCI